MNLRNNLITFTVVGATEAIGPVTFKSDSQLLQVEISGPDASIFGSTILQMKNVDLLEVFFYYASDPVVPIKEVISNGLTLDNNVIGIFLCFVQLNVF